MNGTGASGLIRGPILTAPILIAKGVPTFNGPSINAAPRTRAGPKPKNGTTPKPTLS